MGMDTKGEVGTAEDKCLRYLTILLWAAAIRPPIFRHVSGAG